MRAGIFIFWLLLGSSWPAAAQADGMEGSSGGGGAPAGPSVNSPGVGPAEEVKIEIKPDLNAPGCPEPEGPDETEAPPTISEALQKAAEAMPELKEGYERFNHCLLDGRPCKAREVVSGGVEVYDEAIVVYDDFNSAKGQSCEASKCKRLFEFASEEPYETPGNRGAISVVIHKGLKREIVAQAQLYRAYDNKKFHDSAEGVDLNALAVSEYEARKQSELADALERLKAGSEAGPWSSQDLAAIELFGKMARKRANNHAAAACRLSAYATKNREIENRQSLVGKDEKLNSTGQSAVTGAKVERDLASTISGGAEGKLLLPPDGSEARAKDLQDVFASFDEFRMQEKAQPAEPGLDESLFERVHRKYRQKDKEGAFQRGFN